MPKGPGAPLRPRKPPLTDHLIQAAVDMGMDAEGRYGTLVYGGIDTYERALEIKRSLHRCRQYMGYSLTAEIETDASGKYQVRFTVYDKASGRRYISQKYKGREHEMPYNPFAKTGPRSKS